MTKTIMAISLCPDTKLSAITRGFKAKKAIPNNSFFAEVFFNILPIKYTVPRKLTEISILKRKNVGRKNCRPIKDNGTVKPSQTGPYGKSL
jgi:hypothetical protein